MTKPITKKKKLIWTFASLQMYCITFTEFAWVFSVNYVLKWLKCSDFE